MSPSLISDNFPVILGIETSCDETAVAIVDGQSKIRAHQIQSQIDDHAGYGGVVPEVAARQHIRYLDGLIARVLADAGLTLSAIDAVAATTGPGLVGGLIVGQVTAKAVALAASKPFIAINHLEGHALSPRLEGGLDFPYLLMLMSGGHCQTLAVEGPGRYRRYGSTLDDAAGEAFDKTAKLLGLGYPGGPIIEARAATGKASRFAFPRPLLGQAHGNFSFSGLKTAVRTAAEDIVTQQGGLSENDIDDIAAGFQAAIGDCLADRLEYTIKHFKQDYGPGRALVVAGGVAANKALRDRIAALATAHDMTFRAPPMALCTDNGAMIAFAGVERMKAGLVSLPAGDIAAPVRPRWPLDGEAAAVLGSGKKGRKV